MGDEQWGLRPWILVEANPTGAPLQIEAPQVSKRERAQQQRCCSAIQTRLEAQSARNRFIVIALPTRLTVAFTTAGVAEQPRKEVNHSVNLQTVNSSGVGMYSEVPAREALAIIHHSSLPSAKYEARQACPHVVIQLSAHAKNPWHESSLAWRVHK